MTEDKVSLCFDEDGNVRILDPAAFKHSEDLERESRTLAKKTEEFRETVNSAMRMLDVNSENIEKEKLKAIGIQNQVNGEIALRTQKKADLQSQVRLKLVELERQNIHYQSLLQVETEQTALIKRLGNFRKSGVALSDDWRAIRAAIYI